MYTPTHGPGGQCYYLPAGTDPSAAQSTNPGTQTGYSHGSGIGPTFTSTSAAQHQLPPHSNDPYMMYNNNTYQTLNGTPMPAWGTGDGQFQTPPQQSQQWQNQQAAVEWELRAAAEKQLAIVTARATAAEALLAQMHSGQATQQSPPPQQTPAAQPTTYLASELTRNGRQ